VKGLGEGLVEGLGEGMMIESPWIFVFVRRRCRRGQPFSLVTLAAKIREVLDADGFKPA
jgi:hypothetical protein